MTNKLLEAEGKLDQNIPEERAMLLAQDLSKNGFPAPNPRVGCVILKGGEIVGKGFHDHAGGPHAEIVALQEAGTQAEGSTVMVTLEPCNSHGRTPPCSQALIHAKVKKVIFATPDPNPKMAGGAETLANAGIEVTQMATAAALSEEINRAWLTAIRRKTPFVALKAAMSLDGRIALPTGESKWITGEQARAASHRLRAEYGAVLVGRKTVELDNPLLTARFPGPSSQSAGPVNQPIRIVLDPHNRLTSDYKVFNSEAKTIHVTTQGQTQIDLNALMADLFSQGITAILVEGGAKTLASFVKTGLGDRLHLFAAPKLLGDGPSWLTGLDLNNLADAPRWQTVDLKTHGPDLEWVLEPSQG